jgi:hypothetical protein
MYDVRDQFMLADEKGTNLGREPSITDIRPDCKFVSKPTSMFVLNLTAQFATESDAEAVHRDHFCDGCQRHATKYGTIRGTRYHCNVM